MSGFWESLAEGKANLAIASLPLHLLIAALPHWYSIYQAESNKVQGGWTNQNPRAFVARLNAKAASGKKLSSLEELILRGQAAQQNGYEWWPVWAVAVAFGSLARIPVQQMNRYALYYTLCRLAYTYLYVTTATRRWSYLRTFVFQVSLWPSIAIFSKAAVALGR